MRDAILAVLLDSHVTNAFVAIQSGTEANVTMLIDESRGSNGTLSIEKISAAMADGSLSAEVSAVLNEYDYDSDLSQTLTFDEDTIVVKPAGIPAGGDAEGDAGSGAEMTEDPSHPSPPAPTSSPPIDSTLPSSPISSPPSSELSSQIWVIVAAIVGGVVAVCILVVISIFYKRWRNNNNNAHEPAKAQRNSFNRLDARTTATAGGSEYSTVSLESPCLFTSKEASIIKEASNTSTSIETPSSSSIRSARVIVTEKV